MDASRMNFTLLARLLAGGCDVVALIRIRSTVEPNTDRTATVNDSPSDVADRASFS